MDSLINGVVIIETLIIRIITVIVIAFSMGLGMAMVYELATAKSRVQWDRLVYTVLLILMLQGMLMYLPPMTMRSAATGLEGAREEMPEFEQELEFWRPSNSLGDVELSEQEEVVPPLEPTPIIVIQTLPPPTAIPTIQPTVIYVQPAVEPTQNPLIPPTSVVTPRPNLPPTPSDITREP